MVGKFAVAAILAAENQPETAVAPTDIEPVEVPRGTPLTMKVRTGDSLDRMFKRNALDRTDLANIMSLERARKHLRLIKPGDEFHVRQNNGHVLQLDK